MTDSCKCVNINGQKINLQLWDIPGHERFGGIARVHFKVGNGLISEIGDMWLLFVLTGCQFDATTIDNLGQTC